MRRATPNPTTDGDSRPTAAPCGQPCNTRRGTCAIQCASANAHKCHATFAQAQRQPTLDEDAQGLHGQIFRILEPTDNVQETALAQNEAIISDAKWDIAFGLETEPTSSVDESGPGRNEPIISDTMCGVASGDDETGAQFAAARYEQLITVAPWNLELQFNDEMNASLHLSRLHSDFVDFSWT